MDYEGQCQQKCYNSEFNEILKDDGELRNGVVHLSNNLFSYISYHIKSTFYITNDCYEIMKVRYNNKIKYLKKKVRIFN